MSCTSDCALFKQIIFILGLISLNFSINVGVYEMHWINSSRIKSAQIKAVNAGVWEKNSALSPANRIENQIWHSLVNKGQPWERKESNVCSQLSSGAHPGTCYHIIQVILSRAQPGSSCQRENTTIWDISTSYSQFLKGQDAIAISCWFHGISLHFLTRFLTFLQAISTIPNYNCIFLTA